MSILNLEDVIHSNKEHDSQRTTTLCNTLHYAASHCNALQLILCSGVGECMLQCVAVCCSVFAVCCSLLQSVQVCFSVLQCFAVCCSSVRYIVLQCIAARGGNVTKGGMILRVCISVLQ